MEPAVITIINHSSVPIDLCKASLSSIHLLPYLDRDILTVSKTCLHGHSKIGSFIIKRNFAQFRVKSWGNLVVNTKQHDGIMTFEILEKK